MTINFLKTLFDVLSQRLKDFHNFPISPRFYEKELKTVAAAIKKYYPGELTSEMSNFLVDNEEVSIEDLEKEYENLGYLKEEDYKVAVYAIKRYDVFLQEQTKDCEEKDHNHHIDELEAEIVKILEPTGTDEIGFTDEENAKLRAIYYEHELEEEEREIFSIYENTLFFTVYEYLGEGCVIVNNDTDCDLSDFSKEFKQELLNILKNK